MKKNKKLRFWIFYHLGLLIFSVLTSMLIKYSQTGRAFIPETILVCATIFVLSALIGYLIIFMLNKASKLPHDKMNKRIGSGFIIFLVSVFFIANIVVGSGVFIWYLIKGMPLSDFFSNLIKYELPFANRNLFIGLISFSVVFFYGLWRKSANKEQVLREEKLKYQYQILKSQINPHFLFNSFNALSELIHEDINKADVYIQDLSKMYRYIVDNEDKRLISLKEELSFVENYFNLQKVRNGEKIKLGIDVPNSGNYQTVPVSIQSLVENAIKHNSASVANPLHIDISIENENIVVKNNLQKRTTFEATTQKGLSNLKEQIKLILDRELDVQKNNKQFIVKIPIQS